ncbi:hypothetical protein [Streptacidiphilus neutrinimicus]|uniref:hypothetical protein n=1 Tax=Streptacidiphilus neutrinimicus TaxID=105420 RepID=UPI0005A84AC3|nr:hypothetical protein [Streptacidiphilus neutrinimicus]
MISILREPATGRYEARSTNNWERTGEPFLQDLLQRIGYVPEQRRGRTVLRLPDHLRPSQQRDLAVTAAVTARRLGHEVRLSPDLHGAQAEPLHPRPRFGQPLASLASEIAEAPDSDALAGLLLELTAPVTGLLPSAAAALAEAGLWLSANRPSAPDDHATQLTKAAEQLQRLAARVAAAQAHTAHLGTSQHPPATAPRLRAVPSPQPPVAPSTVTRRAR